MRDLSNPSRLARRRLHSAGPILLACCGLALTACSDSREPLHHRSGAFALSRDIGEPRQRGFLLQPQPGTYRVQGAGDVWGESDAFHFAARPIAGDVRVQGRVELTGKGDQEYAKATLMMRDGFAEDAAFVNVVLHRNGLAALQYRPHAGSPTLELRSTVHNAQRLRLERNGSEFTASVARYDGWKPFATIDLNLPEVLEVGIGVSSRDDLSLAEATFSELVFDDSGEAGEGVEGPVAWSAWRSDR